MSTVVLRGDARAQCLIKGCPNKVMARGWCSKHWQRWKKHDDPLWEPLTPEQRFWAKVNKNGPLPVGKPELGKCWAWTAAKSSDGYGKGKRGGVDFWAHRMAYEMLIGPIPSDLELDHLCRNRACVNPAHLEAVPQVVNTMRGEGVGALNFRKTHCDQGHEFTPENTVDRERGWRRCRICRRDRQRERRALRRAAA